MLLLLLLPLGARAQFAWYGQHGKAQVETGFGDDTHTQGVCSENGIVTIQGVAEGTPISLYGTDGKKLGATIADEGSASINTSLKSGSVGIIRIGDKTVKEVMK